jgi:hypothetical protein
VILDISWMDQMFVFHVMEHVKSVLDQILISVLNVQYLQLDLITNKDQFVKMDVMKDIIQIVIKCVNLVTLIV